MQTEPPNEGSNQNRASQQVGVSSGEMARRRTKELRSNISAAINMVSAENGSDTPDFILAEYLTNCLAAYDAAVCAREKWYGRDCGLLKAPLEVKRPARNRVKLALSMLIGLMVVLLIIWLINNGYLPAPYFVEH